MHETSSSGCGSVFVPPSDPSFELTRHLTRPRPPMTVICAAFHPLHACEWSTRAPAVALAACYPARRLRPPGTSYLSRICPWSTRPPPVSPFVSSLHRCYGSRVPTVEFFGLMPCPCDQSLHPHPLDPREQRRALRASMGARDKGVPEKIPRLPSFRSRSNESAHQGARHRFVRPRRSGVTCRFGPATVPKMSVPESLFQRHLDQPPSTWTSTKRLARSMPRLARSTIQHCSAYTGHMLLRARWAMRPHSKYASHLRRRHRTIHMTPMFNTNEHSIQQQSIVSLPPLRSSLT